MIASITVTLTLSQTVGIIAAFVGSMVSALWAFYKFFIESVAKESKANKRANEDLRLKYSILEASIGGKLFHGFSINTDTGKIVDVDLELIKNVLVPASVSLAKFRQVEYYKVFQFTNDAHHELYLSLENVKKFSIYLTPPLLLFKETTTIYQLVSASATLNTGDTVMKVLVLPANSRVIEYYKMILDGDS